jgi:hypothetical protein
MHLSIALMSPKGPRFVSRIVLRSSVASLTAMAVSSPKYTLALHRNGWHGPSDRDLSRHSFRFDTSSGLGKEPRNAPAARLSVQIKGVPFTPKKGD